MTFFDIPDQFCRIITKVNVKWKLSWVGKREFLFLNQHHHHHHHVSIAFRWHCQHREGLLISTPPPPAPTSSTTQLSTTPLFPYTHTLSHTHTVCQSPSFNVLLLHLVCDFFISSKVHLKTEYFVSSNRSNYFNYYFLHCQKSEIIYFHSTGTKRWATKSASTWPWPQTLILMKSEDWGKGSKS